MASLADLFINKSGIRRERDQAIQVSEEMYNPDTLDPVRQQAQRRASEGLFESEEGQARRQALSTIFRQAPQQSFGVGAGTQIAARQGQDEIRTQALGDFEQRLTSQDLQARRQGEQQTAQIRSQQRQIQSRQDAAKQQAQLRYEQELQRRRQKVGSTIGQLAGTAAAFIPAVGPLGAGAIGAGLGGVFGGSGGALTGGASGLSTSFMMNQFGGDQTEQPDAGELAAQTARDSVSAGEGAQSLGMDLPSLEDLQIEMDLGQPMQVSQDRQLPRVNLDSEQFQPEQGLPQLDLPDLSSAIQNFQGFSEEDRDYTEEELEDAYIGTELEMARGDGLGRTLTDMFIQGLIGVDTKGNRAQTSIADIFMSPFTEGIPLIQGQLQRQREAAEQRRRQMFQEILQQQ